jgi:uncharacterized SAM-dependent methyltransferase
MAERRTTVAPDPRFYEKFNTSQILDIIAGIDVRHEVPYEYSYIDTGAQQWDQHAHELLAAGPGNPLTDVIELIRRTRDHLDRLVDPQLLVNIVDCGVGNGLPVRGLINRFAQRGQLDRYIGLDISPEMLRIAERNIKTWFGGRIRVEGYVRDLNLHLFNGLILGPDRTNIVVFVGGTITHFRHPEPCLQVIRQSMGARDVLLFALELDDEKPDQNVDFSISRPGSTEVFPGRNLVELLNLQPDQYELEQFFDSTECTRQTRIRLTVPVTLHFDLEGQHQFVDLDPGRPLLLRRTRLLDPTQAVDLLHDNGFAIAQTTLSDNQKHLLVLARTQPA